MNDLKFAFRQLLKNPGFTLVAVLTLALGIGANTAIFTLINGFVLKPLPLREPDRLVGVYNESTRTPDSYRGFSYPNYVDLRERGDVFESVMAHNLTTVGHTEGDTTRRVFAACVTANYFATLGTGLALGRPFTLEEERPGSAVPVAIASHRFWQRAGGQPGWLGQTIRLNGRAFTVVGVTPPAFTGTMALFSPDLWLPLGVYDQLREDADSETERSLQQRDQHALMLAGRLKPGVPLADATAALKVVGHQLAQAYPKENGDWTFMAWPLPRLGNGTSPEKDDGQLAAAATLLQAMCGVVLLIASLNLANMLLARGAARRKEFAVRLALGAPRQRIIRQLLTEGLLLSVLGGLAGLLLATWVAQLLAGSLQAALPLTTVFPTTPDARVLAAAAAFCLLSTLFFALGPAWQLSRPDVQADLKGSKSHAVAAGRHRLHPKNLLVLGQLSLSLVLLTAAGLFIRGSFHAARANPGFDAARGLVMEIDAGLAQYDRTRGRDSVRRLVERLGAVPGVEQVSVAGTVPFGLLSLSRHAQRAGVPPPPAGARIDTPAEGKTFVTTYNSIGPDYFRTLGLQVMQGREFTVLEALEGSGSPVALVDQALAQKLWPGENPLGRRLQFASERLGDEKTGDDFRVGASSDRLLPGEQGREFEIVGVVPPLRDSLFERSPQPHVYVPYAQAYRPNVHVHLRLAPGTREAAASLTRTIRRETQAADAQLPVLSLRTLDDFFQASAQVWVVRTGATLFSLFGTLALLLAAVGVYGVKSYAVARRTRELGIRVALGAGRRDVLRMVLREGAVLTVIGLGIGLVLAAGAGQLLAGMLYRVNPLDPPSFGAATLVLAAAALLACYLPARRAAGVDPIVALRTE